MSFLNCKPYPSGHFLGNSKSRPNETERSNRSKARVDASNLGGQEVGVSIVMGAVPNGWFIQ